MGAVPDVQSQTDTKTEKEHQVSHIINDNSVIELPKGGGRGERREEREEKKSNEEGRRESGELKIFY
jgi:N-methylhydantoinase B/oxoprolinase/acetone carboxylase alpha subunit